mgnify:CR=1 FL=1
MSITKHEFSDSIACVTCANADEEQVSIQMKPTPWLFFDKQDVIALAKHFKLTSDDLL